MGSLLMSPTAQFENTGGYVFISDFTYYWFDGKSSVSFSRINLGKRGDGKFRRLIHLTVLCYAGCDPIKIKNILS